MSKPSTNRKTSAWSKGPPTIAATSAAAPPGQRPSSPAQASHRTPSHSRKPSGLGFNEGPVSIPRNAPTHQSRNSVTFGSIDNASSAISSSPPAPASAIKSDGVKTFGSVPATTSSTSAPKEKYDWRKSFRNNPSTSASSTPPSTPSASSIQSPQQSQSQPQSQSQQPHHHQPQGQYFRPNNGPPRSPVVSRQIVNGANRGPPPPAPPTNSMPSPSLSQSSMPGMPSQPAMVPAWQNPFYYDPGFMQPYQWPYMAAPSPQGPSAQPMPPPQPPLPMSPRQPPQPLQQPTTPTPVHAVPNSATHPPPLSHVSSSSISSPPATPLTPSGPASARLNPNSHTFVPNRSSRISFKRPDGTDTNLEEIRKITPLSPSAPSPSPQSPGSPSSANRRSTIVRVETVDAQKKRLEDKERKLKEEQQRTEDAEKKRQAKEEEEEKERLRKEQEAKRLEAEAQKKAEEAAAVAKRKEEEAAAAAAVAAAEKERIRLEDKEKERKKKEEEDAHRKEEEEKEQKRKLEEEEKQRLCKEEEDKKEQATEASKASIDASSTPPSDSKLPSTSKDLEDGEIKENGPIPSDVKSPGAKGKEGFPLRIDTEPSRKTRPGPLDLSGATKSNVVAPLPSALATAKHIERLEAVTYPEGIQSPKPDLNVGATGGKFRYDRDFLLQFMGICKEKPDQLPPLDAIGLEPNDQTFAMARSTSGHRSRQGSNAPVPNRSASVGLGINPPFGKGGPGFNTGGTFGNFAAPGKSNDGRSTPNPRAASVGGMAFGGARPGNMSRTPSQGGPGHNKRTRSQRGNARGDRNNAPAPVPMASSLEPVAPLQQSANRWDRRVLHVDTDSPEMVERKVKGLLNKLTMEKFDSISDQIIAWANRSEKEKDGRTLIQVIRLVFEKATDEAAWSEMYARLCRKMMEQISAKVQDDGIKNAEGKPIAGGQLFRKYLLNRCQEDFERGWVVKEQTAAAAASKSKEDDAVKASNEGKEGVDENDEVALYSEEYYAAQKAKRQGLGLIRFIGELFKLQMLTERIMHECVKKLLGNVETPEEEEIESLCKLLITVGHLLDTVKARAHMDVYFSRMQDMTKSQTVSSRMQFMLQDVLELRERKWITRAQVAAPTTIAAVREQAAKEKVAHEKESYKLQMSMSRGGSRRGGDRGEPAPGPDGWSVAGNAVQRVPPKAGDLSQFGKINKTGPAMSFGPSQIFSKKADKRESVSRTASSSNMFSMLQNAEAAAEDPSLNKANGPPSRKGSVDFSQGNAADGPPQRKRLVLQPRTKPVEDDAPAPSGSGSEDGDSEEMPEADVKKKLDEDKKEFFAVRSIDEAEAYFTGLPASHHCRLIEKLTMEAIESKEADAKLVGTLFSRAVSEKWCSPSAFEEGLSDPVDMLADIAIDAPKAFDLMTIIIQGVTLDDDTRSRITSKDSSQQLTSLLLAS